MILTKWIVKFTIAALGIALIPSTAFAECFNDVEPGNPHYTAICQLKEMGVINGYEDQTFRPYEPVNRAEALKMLMEAADRFPEGEEFILEVTEDPFSDTPKEEWYSKYVQLAKDEAIIHGYEDLTFRPEQNINLVESLKIYLEALPNVIYPDIAEHVVFADTAIDQWYSQYLAYAASRTILDITDHSPGNQVFPEQEMTRGYLAEILYRFRAYGYGYNFGLATWYGAAVQGNYTASGEIFDYNKLTAAHKTLPFGTIVEVVNLSNGKSVVVNVNDRGPYGYGRVIDLSSAAFKEISSLGAGKARVQWRIISTP